MKYTSFFTLALLAVAFTGCDEIEYSDAEPITNPQLPVFDAGEVSATPSSQINQATLNLQSMLDSETELVQVFTVNSSAATLPEGAVVTGAFEVSSSSDFADVYNFESLVNENGTYYIPFNDLLTLQQQWFGKAPVEHTMYFRVPLFADYEDATYRLGSASTYYATGSFNVLGLDPGFTIEDAYYIIGVAGWNPSTDCVKLNHSDASPYDDPTFSIQVTVASNTYWKIVPQSAYEQIDNEGFNFWQALYGVAEDGDASLEGALYPYDPETETEPGSGRLADAGIYTITINMETWTYTIAPGQALPDAPGLPTGIFCRGDFNGWGTPSEDEFLSTEDTGVYVIPYTHIPAGGFKIADADWADVNLGGQGEHIVVGEEYPLNGGDNISLDEDFTGALVLTNSAGSYSILFLEYTATTAGASTGLYLRGGMNDWGTSADYEFLTGPVENVYVLENVSISAGVEFKVADESWGTVNYGSNAGAFDLSSDVLGLTYNAGNISLTKDFTGTITLVNVGAYYYLYFNSASN